jgi:hypothetical protein
MAHPTHWLELDNVTSALSHTSVSQGLDSTVSDTDTGKETTVLDHKLEDMSQRQEGEEGVS